MNEVSFWIIAFICLGMVAFFAFSWVREVDDKYERRLAEQDSAIEISQECVIFLFRFSFADKETPSFPWDAWLDEAQKLDQRLASCGLGMPMTLGQRILKIRDETLAKGGVR